MRKSILGLILALCLVNSINAQNGFWVVNEDFYTGDFIMVYNESPNPIIFRLATRRSTRSNMKTEYLVVFEKIKTTTPEKIAITSEDFFLLFDFIKNAQTVKPTNSSVSVIEQYFETKNFLLSCNVTESEKIWSICFNNIESYYFSLVDDNPLDFIKTKNDLIEMMQK